MLCMAMTPGCKKPAVAPISVKHHRYHLQPLGASAHDLLSNERFKSMVVEVQYMPGQKPQQESLDSLARFLNHWLCKPGGIHVVLTAIPSVSDKYLRKDDVTAIEDRHRRFFARGDTVTLYLLITDGSHKDPNTLGMAYRNTSAVLFGNTLARNSGAGKPLTRKEVETTVLLHEVGHLLSLGNPHGTAFNKRAGKGRHGHCDHATCLMYWATETQKTALIELRGRVPKLDEDCKRALEANGGKTDIERKVYDWSFLIGF